MGSEGFGLWAHTDSNRGPSACKADALNQLSYAPQKGGQIYKGRNEVQMLIWGFRLAAQIHKWLMLYVTVIQFFIARLSFTIVGSGIRLKISKCVVKLTFR